MRRLSLIAIPLTLLVGTVPARAQQPAPKEQVIEEIIARVNNDIITAHQYEQAQETLREELRQDCPTCSAEELERRYRERAKDVLRDLIDQSLLVQKAKDEGLNVDTDVVRRLDELRQQYNFSTMEDFQKAVEASGISWEDYKENIKNSLLTQELIRREVGGRIQISQEEVRKYYEAHRDEFNRPESVALREIFLSTRGKSPAEVAEIRKKAEDLLTRIKNGEDFAQLARRYSEGPTAKNGGDIGVFQHGQLSKQVEEAVFKLNRNQVTPVLETPQGFEILQVVRHYQAGIQPLNVVEDEIMNRLYMERLGPALREYLKELRQQSYIRLKPGYTDTAAVPTTTIEEVSPDADEGAAKKRAKKTDDE